LRGERRWREAARVYARVASEHPSSEESYVASVALASLRLEHLGDPAGARRGYQRALSAHPSGTLAEECRYGIAQSYRAQDRSSDEAEALRAFLSSHPDGVMAASARARLRTLEPQ
jgi:hypothetical protein